MSEISITANENEKKEIMESITEIETMLNDLKKKMKK